MKIVIDSYVPFLRGLLEPYATIRYLEPEQITAETVKDADALIIRTRTRCNEDLLAGSKVKFIATATIGFDHIDTAYCEEHGITWTNSAGCNAQGVCDYVEAALDEILCWDNVPSKPIIGVVGVGHVGTLVAKMAQTKGFPVRLCDPFLSEEEKRRVDNIGDTRWVSFEGIAHEADIVTFHTPLTTDGEHPTRYMCDKLWMQKLKANAVIINAARGGVVKEREMLPNLRFVIDTWEGEPRICKHTLAVAQIGTFHIAGYTLQGKVNATNMCLAALAQKFGLPKLTVNEEMLPLRGDSYVGWLKRVDSNLRNNVADFEELRETYLLR